MNNDLLLRPLTPADDAAYRALWVEAMTRHAQSFSTSLSDAPDPGIPTHYTDNSFTLGAFLGDQLAGIASLQRDTDERLRHKALVSRVFVRTGTEGSGLGKTLVRELILRAEAISELRQLYLKVLASNERAQRLYASLGFRGYAREPDAVRFGERFVDEIQMLRFLRREPRQQ
jgi:cyclohexyl-isocyanide hydratase